MTLNTRFPETLQPYFIREMAAYRQAYNRGDLPTAWHHLERAHVIGQRYPVPHTYVHWVMLRFGFRIKSGKEIAGQLPRLLVGGVKSFVGKVPLGNPGGANVPPMRSFPLAEDIGEMFRLAGIAGD
ncbi:uncharacterized protein DUF3703 [Neolewinella xylanilytica]|uniref:Uncharacterized protein DUF3703 n=1 Tax=Neolewinella xylanilytica TaxID=1514080 RepID=A0A2S6I3J0_9BACT|nr:DUF3703 domain-containing protein [Neolewinella xylanilytica]PPK85629.1 uncharacterized protein DUF3703 [Neolewinella xylanilytica]